MKFRDLYRRIHFYGGNVHRLLTTPKCQLIIDIKEACTLFGSSFAVEGWNHLRSTLHEYDLNNYVSYRHTSLYLFLKYFKPASVCELVEVEASEVCNLPLFVYPWGSFNIGNATLAKDPLSSRFCGPSTDEFIKCEFERTITLYEKMKISGYQPWLFGNSFIGGGIASG